jgi:hypothetical protein
MKTAIKTLDFNGIGIQFSADGWLNATASADALGKERLDNFLASSTYLEYASVVAKANSLEIGELKKARRGRYGSGTFLHPELAVCFARWISPDFAYWCDKQVPALLQKARNAPALAEQARTRKLQRLGRPESVIAKRNEGVANRLIFTTSLQRHGVAGSGFGDCTRAIYFPLFGGGTDTIKQKLAVPDKGNVRDYMTGVQLATVSLAESIAAERIEKEGTYGNMACTQTCNQVGQAVAQAVRAGLRQISS